MIAYYQSQSSSTIMHSIIQELKPKLQLLQLSLPRGSTLFWQATRVTLPHVLVSSYNFPPFLMTDLGSSHQQEPRWPVYLGSSSGNLWRRGFWSAWR